MGKNVFQAIVKEAGVHIGKTYVMARSMDIADSAIKKFKKSKEYQDEIQAAMQRGKQKEKAKQKEMKMQKAMAKVKKQLKGMDSQQQKTAVEKYGLQAVKKGIDSHIPRDLRPRWVGVPHFVVP